MAGMCRGQNRQLQHGWIVFWSKISVLAWLECFVVDNVSFSMSGMCRGQNRQFQHGWYVL
jgi:hypothetical protein